MKALFCYIAGTAAAVGIIFAGYWLAASICIHPRTAEKISVPLVYHTPKNSGETVRLNPKEQETLNKALAAYGPLVRNTEIYLSNRRSPATWHSRDSEGMVRYSLRLTLRDGTQLTSKPRLAQKSILAPRLKECIRSCMQRYRDLAKTGRTASRISNI